MNDSISIERVKEWLVSLKEEARDIGSDFDLIENKIIDSLVFLQFIQFLEELTGKEQNIEEINIDMIRTLNQIKENFLSNFQQVT